MTTIMRMVSAVAVALLALVSLSDGASAQTALERILKDKKIRITAEVTSPPFGILDKDGKPDGSEIATARQLAKDLGVELEFVQVTAPNRIPALLADRADLAISSLSITLDRAKTVMFANPHGALSIVITAPKGTAIKSAADLAGKKVGITRATLEEATVPRMAPQGTNIVYFDDIAATIQALLSGQVDCAGWSAFASKSVADRNPARQLEDKFTVTTAYYAIAVKPGNYDLLQWINTWVMMSKLNGNLAQIYEKYTGVKLVELPVF
ncbi:MAG: transporter substrate-binding domain-containing protein [Alphaproteobacteria bacterium]|nr:transporter substrate-binding domain-containing protein [Alphaproteobacteria bacterium]